MLAKIFDAQLCPLIQKSLSICPKNKKNVCVLDDLKKQSGYIQWHAIKHIENILTCNEQGNKTSILINDVEEQFNNTTIDEKNNYMNIIHEQGQNIISQMFDEMKEVIRKNPSKYQSQLCETAGLSGSIYHDNNRIGATLFNIMENQQIITSTKILGRKYFTIKNDKPYTPFSRPPTCGQSMLESKLAEYLINQNIYFVQQYKFTDCKYKKPLPFDFKIVINDIELYVEVDGKQHYEFVPYFHKCEDDFLLQQKKDKIKTNYMAENELHFLRIKYDENIVETFNSYVNSIIN
jgi:very-short-patch-repair endonuclease